MIHTTTQGRVNTAYTFTYITIHYACGCDVIRRILRHQAGAPEQRSSARCASHSELHKLRYETLRESEARRQEVSA